MACTINLSYNGRGSVFSCTKKKHNKNNEDETNKKRPQKAEMPKYEKIKLHQNMLIYFVDMLCNIFCRYVYPFSFLED